MADDERHRRIDIGPAADHAPACSLAQSRPDAADELGELLSEIALHDRDAFTRFYRSTHHRVFGLALRILRRPPAAEEVTQEVYLHVWNSAAQYDARLASPIGWLMMLAHRRSVDRVRTDSSATVRDLTYGRRHLPRDHDVVAETVGQRSDERAVVDCLDTLTDLQRETVGLAYYGGRTYAEVADQLEIPLSTVKTRIRNGLERLQKCLSKWVRDD